MLQIGRWSLRRRGGCRCLFCNVCNRLGLCGGLGGSEGLNLAGISAELSLLAETTDQLDLLRTVRQRVTAAQGLEHHCQTIVAVVQHTEQRAFCL
ncbi:hypothetical protein D9M71_713860 [compost metagenome]